MDKITKFLNDLHLWKEYVQHITPQSSVQKVMTWEDNVHDIQYHLSAELLQEWRQRNAHRQEFVLDLHNLTQNEAYEILRSFVIKASAAKISTICVITGKGSVKHQASWKNTGVLHHLVPRWLCEKPFNMYVASFGYAPPSQGGRGALIISVKP